MSISKTLESILKGAKTAIAPINNGQLIVGEENFKKFEQRLNNIQKTFETDTITYQVVQESFDKVREKLNQKRQAHESMKKDSLLPVVYGPTFNLEELGGSVYLGSVNINSKNKAYTKNILEKFEEKKGEYSVLVSMHKFGEGLETIPEKNMGRLEACLKDIILSAPENSSKCKAAMAALYFKDHQGEILKRKINNEELSLHRMQKHLVYPTSDYVVKKDQYTPENNIFMVYGAKGDEVSTPIKLSTLAKDVAGIKLYNALKGAMKEVSDPSKQASQGLRA